MNYSCYISIHNQTGVDLLLYDSSTSQGHFGKESPPNTIESNSSASSLIVVDDDVGLSGSAAKCKYEIYLTHKPDQAVYLDLEFGCPFEFGSNNYLRAKSSSSDLTFQIQPYSTSGGRFSAIIVRDPSNPILMASASTVPNSEGQINTAMVGMAAEQPEFIGDVKSGDQPMQIRAMYHTGFKTGIGPFTVLNHKPVHENIAIAAFIQSKLHFPRGTTYNNLTMKQWEYFRGLLWNDDPACLLFNDQPTDNHSFGWGADWADAYFRGSPDSITQRSHFHDLQFLHAMATTAGEDPSTTKKALVAWFETMYKLACGDQGVSQDSHLDASFAGGYFNSTSRPSGNASQRDLILGTTRSYQAVNINQRALGICMHIIADSYAVGHTKRRVLNPDDLDISGNGGTMRFKLGKYGRFGSVITFHTYLHQDEKTHGHYDDGGDSDPIPHDLDTFNGIIGARDAIDKSKTLIDHFVTKTKWENGVKQFVEDDVFKLDPNATASNTSVD